MAASLLEVQGLTTVVHGKSGSHPAVSDLSFSVDRGETLGLVGESGSGKSLTGLSIVGLNPKPATEIVRGSVRFDGLEVLSLSPGKLRRVRGAQISMILQDPKAALNPVWTVGEQIKEALRLHRGLRGKALQLAAVEALQRLKVSDAEQRLGSYPHHLSGGLSQRVVAAIALACAPSLLIADEPTTALDATIEAAFLAHLREIQAETELGILFITHDFSVLNAICDRVAVIYAGEMMELEGVQTVLRQPLHPYSQALVRALPVVRTRPRRLLTIPGQPPSLSSRPTGCAFHPRCWLYEQLGCPDKCRTERPPMATLGERKARCHFLVEAASAPMRKMT